MPGRLTISYDYLRYQIDGPIINIARIGTGYYADKDDILVVYDTFLPDTSDGKYNADLAKITKPEHVIPEMKAQFKSTVPMQTLAMIAEDFTIESTENVTINGWDMCKTKGHLIFSKDRFKAFVDYKASYVAYSVIKDGYPVYFVVVDNSEEQVKGAELEGMALKVAKTFRDYKE